MNRILAAHQNAGIRVYAVWQPMLPTDWGRPGRIALGRLVDPRVAQFWDVDHVVARRLAADATSAQPSPDCCDMDGILWDLAAVYPAGATWTDRLPPAVFLNGTVASVASSLEMTLTELTGIRENP